MRNLIKELSEDEVTYRKRRSKIDLGIIVAIIGIMLLELFCYETPPANGWRYDWIPIGIFASHTSEIEPPIITYEDSGTPSVDVLLKALPNTRSDIHIYFQDVVSCTANSRPVEPISESQAMLIASTGVREYFMHVDPANPVGLSCVLGKGSQPRMVDFVDRSIHISLLGPRPFFWTWRGIQRPPAHSVNVESAIFQVSQDLPVASIVGGLSVRDRGSLFAPESSRELSTRNQRWAPAVFVRYAAPRAAQLVEFGKLIVIALEVAILAFFLCDLLVTMFLGERKSARIILQAILRLEARIDSSLTSFDLMAAERRILDRLDAVADRIAALRMYEHGKDDSSSAPSGSTNAARPNRMQNTSLTDSNQSLLRSPGDQTEHHNGSSKHAGRKPSRMSN